MVIERIEIIKGATSIYGNGASGGIINIITQGNNSRNKINGSTTLGYTFHDIGDKMFTSEAGAGFRFMQKFYGKIDKFDYFISGNMQQTGVMLDGENEVISPRYGLGETVTWNTYVKLGYQLNEDNRLELMYNFFNSIQKSKFVSQNGNYGSSPSIGVLGDHKGDNEGTPYNHNLSLKYLNKNIFSNSSFIAMFYLQDLYTIYDYRSPPRWFNGGQSAIRGEKYGLRFNFDTKVEVTNSWISNFVYGLDGLIDKTSQPLVDGRYWVPWLTGTNLAPFLQTKSVFNNHYIFKLGARYDYLNVNIPNYSTVPNNNKPINVKGGTLDYKKVTFNVGFAFTQIKFFQPYISYSQGFSIYDLGRILRSATESTVSELNTKPIVTNNYEIGFNSDISHELYFSGSFFQSIAKIGADLVSVDGFWVPERAPQKIWGWELEAKYNVFKKLKLSAAYSWQEGKSKLDTNVNYNKYLSGLLIAPAKLNFNLVYQPVTKFSFSLYYIHSFSRNRFQTKDGIYEEGKGNVRAINLFNSNVNYQINKSFNLNLGIENLFNKAYYTQTSMINARDAEYARGNGRYTSLTLKYNY